MRLRTSPAQFDIMVKFMERHGDLNKATKMYQDITRNIRLWDELTAALNSDGSGIKKTSDKWKKVWSDFKSKTKIKAKKFIENANNDGVETGAGVLSSKLSELEHRVLAVAGTHVATGVVEGTKIVLIETDPLNSVESPACSVASDSSESDTSTQPASCTQWEELRSEPMSPSSQAETIRVTSASSKLAASDFNEPSTSTQPVADVTWEQLTFRPTKSTSPSENIRVTSAGPRRRLVLRRRFNPLNPPSERLKSPRKVKSDTDAEESMPSPSTEFQKTDAEWRVFLEEKEKREFKLEQERLRLREIELQQQSRWQELFAQFLSMANTVIDTLVKKNK